ncbi:MAG TPA: DUF4159 domain-containing protein [Gammaproteobacteria bacterium]
MSSLRLAVLLAAFFLVIAALSAQPREFREYPGAEYNDYPLPTDYREPAEWTFARLMYPPHSSARWGLRTQWEQGGSTWTIDYPRGDRHIVEALERLTSVDARSVEQPVNLDDGDDVFYWPWLYVVEPGTWDLTDAQAAKLREYLLRGGFLMADDFHGTWEWAVFTASMQRVFPDRAIVDIDAADPIFHTIWDMDGLQQIPGYQFLRSGRTYEQDGVIPRWRAIYDDEGRIMVAICHNMDLGDAVEHADTPEYPEEYSAQALRIFGNYLVYAFTH